jgi:hypothetical protein
MLATWHIPRLNPPDEQPFHRNPADDESHKSKSLLRRWVEIMRRTNRLQNVPGGPLQHPCELAGHLLAFMRPTANNTEGY